jgi:hypothetical protein
VSRLSLSRRRGVSLVELVGVMLAGAALMGVTVGAIVAMQGADRRFARRASDRQSLGLLVERLRRDVHAASRAAWDEDARLLSLEQPRGGQVTYRLIGKRWERRISNAPDAAPRLAGAFVQPASAACSVEPRDAEAGTLLRLHWIPRSEPQHSSRTAPAAHELVAAVGRDLALLHP